MGTLLEAIDIMLETHFKFGFPNGSPETALGMEHEGRWDASSARTPSVLLDSPVLRIGSSQGQGRAGQRRLLPS